MIEPHYQQTKKRIQNSKTKYILAIQDQMRLNFTKHKAKTELGSIGKAGKTEQYGVIQHSVLCITDKNEPLGLMDVRFFDYDDIDTTINRADRNLEDKANTHWVDALKTMRKRLGKIDKPIITVADREGDFYEFLHELIKNDEKFVIRSQHNRITGDIYVKNGTKLRELLQDAPIKGAMEVIIQDVGSREIKEIILNLKAIEVTIPPSKKLNKEQLEKYNYQSIKINVVIASNEEHEWVLLTNLPIAKIDEIKEIVTIYRSRWHIEDYHKVLKTGYQVDEIYLHSSRQAILNLLTMAAISACRLYWVIYIGRSETSIKADQIFEDFEWKSMYVYFKEKIPDECPSLADVVLRIAQLGGYKPMKNAPPPGIKAMWIGYQHFTIAAQMYRNMSTTT
ncbi:MAG: IS4 family transposase [bacterium]|nr:IS4 family transposase [bacterium]